MSFKAMEANLLGGFFIAHYVLNVSYSVASYGLQVGSYNCLWICSMSLLISAFGLLRKNHDLVATGLIAVGSGHTLWMLDTLYMILYNVNQGPINIADYNSLSGKPTFLSVFTTTHHLWFMPLCIVYLRSNSFVLRWKHLKFSSYWIMFIGTITIIYIPMQCVDIAMKGGGTACIDVNVNMVKHWWGMDNIRFFHLFDRDKGNSVFVHWLYSNVVHNFGCNGVIWCLLRFTVFRRRVVGEGRGEGKKVV